MSLADIAKIAGKTGGLIAGHAHLNAQGAGPSFGTHLVDLEVDRDRPGHHPALHRGQDAGRAVAPELRRRPVSGWCCAGHRLGAERGVRSTARTAACRTRPSSIACRSPRRADDRHGDRRGAEPARLSRQWARRRSCRPWRRSRTRWSRRPIRFTELLMSPPKVLKAIDAARANGGPDTWSSPGRRRDERG